MQNKQKTFDYFQIYQEYYSGRDSAFAASERVADRLPPITPLNSEHDRPPLQPQKADQWRVHSNGKSAAQVTQSKIQCLAPELIHTKVYLGVNQR